MHPDQIPQADLLDILFEGRNKNYGAYDLRKHYTRRLGKAILLTLSLCLLLVFGYTWAGKMKKDIPAGRLYDFDTVSLARPLPPEKQIVLPPPPAHPTVPQQVATLNDSRPRIVPDDQVKPNERPHTVDEMKDARLGTANHEGIPDDNTGPVGPANGDGKGLFNAPAQNPYEADSTFRSVEIESKYKGGSAAWIPFLQKNFRLSEEALANGIQGTVTVQFIVDKEGNVSDVVAIGGPEEYKQEAVRVIKKSGQWDPAIQNGRHVSSYKKQPIVILLGNND
jgi:protein TonB